MKTSVMAKVNVILLDVEKRLEYQMLGQSTLEIRFHNINNISYKYYNKALKFSNTYYNPKQKEEKSKVMNHFALQTKGWMG